MKIFQNWANVVGSAAAVLMVATACEVVARAVIVDRNQACVENLYSLGIGVEQYVQDYDELLPQAASGPAFQSAVEPYTQGNASVFFCPATRNQPYVMNPAFASQPILTASSSHDIPSALVYDSVAHPNGAVTIFFNDGHVEQGGVYQAYPISPPLGPHDDCIDRARHLGFALESYSQDYDGDLPPMDSYAHFQAALLPYIWWNYDFQCPETLAPYTINTALNGHKFIDFADPSTVEVLTDSVPHSDGTVTTLYLDAHAYTTTP